MGDISKYFNKHEFACHCGCGENNISPVFVLRLDGLRELFGMPIKIISGYRCKKHNEAVGGVEDSAHRAGLAADIDCKNGHDRFTLVRHAINAGFNRIGIGKSYIHLDIDIGKPKFVIWTYYK